MPPRRPAAGPAAFAAIGCAIVAVGIAKIDAFAGDLVSFPIPPALLAVAIGALAFGLREMSVRRQFRNQAEALMATLENVRDKNRLLNMTEIDAQIGHWRVDFDTEILTWSDGTCKMHGIEPGSKPTLQQAIDFYHPDDIPVIARLVERAKEHGDSYDLNARLVRENGELRNIECRGHVEMGPDGRPAYLFGMVRDRTDEEIGRAELRAARDDAEALASSKGQFLARMSHEIRTPMNGVLGFAELLGRTELTSEQRRQVDFIIESGKSLQALLNDILDLSKIESGKVEINSGTVDIHHLVYRVTQMAEPVAREKAIRLAYDTAPNVPRHVVLDALRLRQILSNLLSNAVRFTDEGGVSVSLSCVEGKLRFAVCDTGTGISNSMLEQIFDPFSQERNHPTNSRGGTGLGLAISRQLAELMGGSLTVRSEPGEGSVFTLTMPLVGASAPPASKEKDRAEIAANLQDRGARVLLAEDYDINRELITEMTRQLGVEVECAEDGVEAVAMVRHAADCGRPYALVLMDLQMPRLDGLEATRDLRQGGMTSEELPIIALTANAFVDDIENCLAAGMQAHLSKPLSMERLADALNRWMPAGTDMTVSANPPMALR